MKTKYPAIHLTRNEINYAIKKYILSACSGVDRISDLGRVQFDIRQKNSGGPRRIVGAKVSHS